MEGFCFELSEVDGDLKLDAVERKRLFILFVKTLPESQFFTAKDMILDLLNPEYYCYLWRMELKTCKKILVHWKRFIKAGGILPEDVDESLLKGDDPAEKGKTGKRNKKLVVAGGEGEEGSL